MRASDQPKRMGLGIERLSRPASASRLTGLVRETSPVDRGRWKVAVPPTLPGHSARCRFTISGERSKQSAPGSTGGSPVPQNESEGPEGDCTPGFILYQEDGRRSLSVPETSREKVAANQKGSIMKLDRLEPSGGCGPRFSYSPRVHRRHRPEMGSDLGGGLTSEPHGNEAGGEVQDWNPMHRPLHGSPEASR